MDDASTTTSGASNASDFQPPTQNPQTASPNLQPSGRDLQPLPREGTADRLDQLPATPLTVETARSNTSSDVSQVSDPGFGSSVTGFLPFLVALLIAIWLFRRWNLFNPGAATVQPAGVEEPAADTAPEKTTKKTVKKPTNSRPRKKTKSKTKR